MSSKEKKDKISLSQGFQKILISFLLFFIGPSLVYLALSNDDKPYYLLLLTFSIILCIAAMVIFFMAINTIVKSLFQK